MTEKTDDTDYLAQYISKIESQNKITNSPLLVIDDGFAFDYAYYKENYDNLSNSDIKQIDYLSKDSETAINIYGERAKGGVLLITTNKFGIICTTPIDNREVLILLGEKQISKKEFKKLNPADIKSIEVINKEKDVQNKTKDKYDGIVIIRMKKEKKR